MSDRQALRVAGRAAAAPILPAGHGPTRCLDDTPTTLEPARQLAGSLVGQTIPELALRTGTGSTVKLRRETATGAVIYIYPAASNPPAGPDTAASEDVAQHRVFDREREVFRGYGLKVFGLNSEPERDARMRVLENRIGHHQILSDPELALGRTLGLPTFTHGGVSYYRRLTIVAFAGQVAKVFYPVDSPRRSASQVICWLRLTGH
jgi:peroxiredoxin